MTIDKDQTGAPSQAEEALSRLTSCSSYKAMQRLPVWENVKVADLEPGVDQLLTEVKAEFAELEQLSSVSWETLMVPLERLESRLWDPASRVSHLQSVKFDEAMKEAYEQVRTKIVDLSTEMNQSQAIYNHIRQLMQDESLSLTRQRVVAETIKGMEHSGVHLEGEAKARFKAITQRLSELTEQFQNNLIKEAQQNTVVATSAQEVVGLPEAVVAQAIAKTNELNAASETKDAQNDNATADSGPWTFGVSGANYLPIMERCESRVLREKMYRAFKQRGMAEPFDNRPILEEILNLRQEKAKLLEFDHYSAFSIDKKMAPSVGAVDELLARLRDVSLPAADQELETLKAFIKSQATDAPDELAPWDIAFWTERYRQTFYNIDQEKIREYLPVDRVMSELFKLMNELFEIEITPVPAGEVPTWHDAVTFYEVKEAGELIAGFFMDPYERAGEKREGAWMNTVVDRSEALAQDGTDFTLPIALFIMNARQPAEGQPGLFSLNEAETLFHEFGHALQHMLTRVNEGSASGINLVEWDAVEVASQFNENWLYQRSFLKTVSQHVNTGESLDDATIDKILESRNYWAGNGTLRQLLFALTDLRIHEQAVSDEQKPYTVEKSLRKTLIRTPFLEEETQLPAFGHLFAGGYAAGYYSYKWAEVMAADAFARFEEAGLEDLAALKPIAKHYRDTVLAQGGSQSALEVFRAFRGRDATADALLRQQGLL